MIGRVITLFYPLPISVHTWYLSSHLFIINYSKNAGNNEWVRVDARQFLCRIYIKSREIEEKLKLLTWDVRLVPKDACNYYFPKSQTYKDDCQKIVVTAPVGTQHTLQVFVL